MSSMSEGHNWRANFPRLKNRNCPKHGEKTISQKNMENDKIKEKQIVSKAKSAGKVVSAKARNFCQGRAQFPFLVKGCK